MNKSELREVQVKELSPVLILKNNLRRTNNTFDEKKTEKTYENKYYKHCKNTTIFIYYDKEEL